MKLTDANIDEKLKVTEVNNYTQRLNALGVFEGCEICPLLKNSHTLLVDVNGCRYAMGKEVAEFILVKRVS